MSMLCYNIWIVVRFTNKINGILPALPRVLSVYIYDQVVLLINITHTCSNVHLE